MGWLCVEAAGLLAVTLVAAWCVCVEKVYGESRQSSSGVVVVVVV